MIQGLLDDTTIQLASGRRLAFTTWGEPAGGVVFYLHGTGHSRLPGLRPGDRWLLADAARCASFDAAAQEAYRQGAEGVASDRVARFLPWGFRIEDLAMDVNLFLAAEDTVFPPSRADD